MCCVRGCTGRDTLLPSAHQQSRQELKPVMTILASYLNAGIQTETLCGQLK